MDSQSLNATCKTLFNVLCVESQFFVLISAAEFVNATWHKAAFHTREWTDCGFVTSSVEHDIFIYFLNVFENMNVYLHYHKQ